MATKHEQHIAVFGERGSGKTVLLSTLFGVSGDPEVIEEAGHRVVAMDVGQGERLRSMYLGMKTDHRAPRSTSFTSDAYRFELRPVKDEAVETKEVVGLVWHDYPGEWFEATPDSTEQESRRVATFRNLMSSHVALLLVDAQRLADHHDEEGRYLKGLFANYTNALAALRNDILEDGERLSQFPRIWTVALSKADILPDMTADGLRDLITLRAPGTLAELRAAISEFVAEPDALSVGEDYVLLSSGRFDPDVIDLRKRIGLDLLFPIATMLPFQRYLRWDGQVEKLGKKAVRLAHNVSEMGKKLDLALDHLPAVPRWANSVVKVIGFGQLVAPLAESQFQKILDQAETKHQPLRAMLARFGLALERGKKSGVLRESEQ